MKVVQVVKVDPAIEESLVEDPAYLDAMSQDNWSQVARLFTSATVKRVIAHTLPQFNASARVLEKVAIDFVGEVVNPDDGQVWQWQTQAPP